MCSRERLEAWLDGELDAAGCDAVARHVERCPGCAGTAARLREQKAAIRADAPYYPAPTGLRESIHAAVGAADRPASTRRTFWLAWAAAAILAVSAGWMVLRLRSDEAQAIARANLAGNLFDLHLRSLIGTLVDVPSSDQHTVKPWFAGKLDYSPEVKNLDAGGFSLAGGRLDFVAGHRVAVIVYRRRQHVISLFIWPLTSREIAGGAGETERDGYNLIHWVRGSMTCWAVSDVSVQELRKLKSLYEQ